MVVVKSGKMDAFDGQLLPSCHSYVVANSLGLIVPEPKLKYAIFEVNLRILGSIWPNYSRMQSTGCHEVIKDRFLARGHPCVQRMRLTKIATASMIDTVFKRYYSSRRSNTLYKIVGLMTCPFMLIICS